MDVPTPRNPRSVKISDDERGGWSSDRPRKAGAPKRPPDLSVRSQVLRPSDRLRYSPGSLLVIASASGRDSYVGEPLYIASKWGVVGMGHAVRKELAASNIRVTLIEPGLVDTPLTRGSPVVRPLPQRAQTQAAKRIWFFRTWRR